jgi:predicted ArsR family transcriptional regulator
MERKIEKKYDQGTYNAEFVSKIPPLGEDRKTQIVFDLPPEKVAAIGGQTLALFLAEIMEPLSKKFGDEVWEIAGKAMYEIGRNRAQTMAKAMKVEDLKDARCLGRIMDMEDHGCGIRGEWVETGKKKAVKHEYDCPMAEPIKKSPKVCSVLMEAMERGTFDGLGVKLKNPVILTKIIPNGDAYCEVKVELAD